MKNKDIVKNLNQIKNLVFEDAPNIAGMRIKWLIKDIENQEYPDAKKHQIVSFIKSGFRIFGYGLLLVSLEAAVILLILSEIIGIYEELV